LKASFGDEVFEMPGWVVALGVCAIIASAVLWA